MEARFSKVDRKVLVAAVSEILGVPSKYMGMPSAEYRIGEFTVDRNRSLIWADDHNPVAVENLIDGLAHRGIDFDDYTVPQQAQELADGLATMMEARDNKVTAEEAAAYAELEMYRMMVEEQNVPDYSNRGPYGGDDIEWDDECGSEDSIDENDPQTEDEDGVPNILTISVPREGFSPEAYDNLTNLVNSKFHLMESAINGFGLNIHEGEVDGQPVLMFPWFEATTDPDEVRAYTDLVTKLCEMAKKAMRILRAERATPNERFSLRIFLVRLGMVGQEYRTSRRILLRNTSGSSAWKNGAPPKRDIAEKEVG